MEASQKEINFDYENSVELLQLTHYSKQEITDALEICLRILVNLISILIFNHSFVIYLFSKLLPQITQNLVEGLPNETIDRKSRLIREEISKTVIKVSKDFIFDVYLVCIFRK